MAYIPRGGEFRVNSQTNGDQAEPDIASLDDGSFLVLWRDQLGTAGDNNGASIRAQRYSAQGAPMGGEFQVNTQAVGDQVRPKVTAINGGFVVTWTDTSGVGDGSSHSISAQIFELTDGLPVGSEFVVNTQTVSMQGLPGVGRLTNGGFVVTWSDVVDTAVRAQIYTGLGAPVGGERTINHTTSTQEQSSVAGLSNGTFVIVWESDNPTGGDNSGESVNAQMFAADGTKIGLEFLVNTTTAGDQQLADVAALTGGGFVVTWRDGSGTESVKAQLFDGTGAKTGGEFTVNTTAGGQDDPSVSALPNGDFVVAWRDASVPSNTEVRAQVFNAEGQKVGLEFHVNTQTADNQFFAAVAGTQNGGFAIAWADRSGTLGDSSGASVKAQIYQQLVPLDSNDFNSDGKSDILWREASGFIAEWQMNGDQIMSNTAVATLGNEWKFQDTGDFTGGGTSDILWRDPNGQFMLWQMNGDKIARSTIFKTASNDYHVQGVADFNGDGRTDILLRHDSGQVILWQMRGDALFTEDTVFKNTAIAVPSRDYHIEGVGDFNVDGKSDVLFRHDSGQVVLWQMDADKIVSNTAVGQVSQDYHVQGIGDFNGDGKSDVLFRHDSGQVVLWQMDGDKVVSNTAIAVVSNDYKIQDVRDFNGDGFADVLWRHVSGQVILWEMHRDQVVSNTAIQTVPNNWTILTHHYDLL